MNHRTLLILGLFLVAGSLMGSSCFDGSSSGPTVQPPAEARIRTSPEQIDTGDRTEVEVELFDFVEDEIAIKIKYPLGLVYVSETAFLVLDGELVDIGPDEEESDSTDTYLVFYFSTDDLVDADGNALSRMELIFELEGNEDVSDGTIEVDIDLDNPDVSNSSEFAVATPKFDAQDSNFIQVGEGSSSSSSSSG